MTKKLKNFLLIEILFHYKPDNLYLVEPIDLNPNLAYTNA
jgi:hypothetical protein